MQLRVCIRPRDPLLVSWLISPEPTFPRMSVVAIPVGGKRAISLSLDINCIYHLGIRLFLKSTVSLANYLDVLLRECLWPCPSYLMVYRHLNTIFSLVNFSQV